MRVAESLESINDNQLMGGRSRVDVDRIWMERGKQKREPSPQCLEIAKLKSRWSTGQVSGCACLLTKVPTTKVEWVVVVEVVEEFWGLSGWRWHGLWQQEKLVSKAYYNAWRG